MGLRDGWISIDGQKKAFVDFAGAREGELDAAARSGEHDVVAKIETADGVSVIDVRRPHKRVSWRGASVTSSKL